MWTPSLSSDEVDFYHREGYLIPKVNLSEEELHRFQQSLDRVVEQNPGVRPEFLVSAHLETKGAEGVRGSYDFLELGQQPLILEAVAQVLGSNFALWGCQIFCKPGYTGMEVPMHQDGEYWPIRPLSTVTVWVALDRSDKENGALRVVPRSHQERRIFQHETCEGLVLSQRLTKEELGKLEAPMDVELEPGQFSMHDVFLVHGSNPNRSPRRRAGVALRYMPTSSHLDREMYGSDRSGFTIDWRNRPVFLVSGQDHYGKNTYSPLPGSLALPEGFRRSCFAKSPEQWLKLQSWMEVDTEIPWEHAIEGRRVAQWGVRYDYVKQCVDVTAVTAIPDVLRDFFPEVGPEFTQCIINEYGPHDGIPWHVDDLLFGPEILVFVFGDSRPLLLRQVGDGDEASVRSVEMRHLWSYCFSGAARYDWQHSIPEGLQKRWSFTFRSLKVSYCK